MRYSHMLSNKVFIQPHSGEILVDVDTAKFKRGVAPTYFKYYF